MQEPVYAKLKKMWVLLLASFYYMILNVPASLIQLKPVSDTLIFKNLFG